MPPKWIVGVFVSVLAVIVLNIPSATAKTLPNRQTQTVQTECVADLDSHQVRYDMQAELDWASKIVEVTQTVTYRNDSEDTLSSLVFHSEPHRLSRVNTLTLNYAQDTDGNILNNVTIDAMRITVPLQTAVTPGCEVTITLRYAINTQPLSDANPLGWLAYTEQQLNLGHWFPTIGLYGFREAGEWYTPQRHYIGEQAVTLAADYVLDFQVIGAPAGLMLVAPGTVESTSAMQWRITHRDARELALSLSTGYTRYAEDVGGVTVEWYIYSEPGQEAIDRAMTDARQALQYFNEAFGDYSHERLVIVEGDFPDGYEFTGLVFVSTRWFEIWNGNTMHWLTIITVHEIAHQWWYAMVGNDQSLDPYLDEALATYSEYLYFQEFYPSIAEQWWAFRVDRYNIVGSVDSTVYEYTQWRPYINAVYLNGVRMLNSIRDTIGDDAFLNWLQTYATEHNNGVVTQQDFWAALGDAYNDLEPIITAYFSNTDPRG